MHKWRGNNKISELHVRVHVYMHVGIKVGGRERKRERERGWGPGREICKSYMYINHYTCTMTCTAFA